MTPGIHNFPIVRGDHIIKKFRLRPAPIDDVVQPYIDFDGYTGRSHIRDERNITFLAAFEVTTDTDDDGPYIQIYLDKAKSEALTVAVLPYDVEMTDPTGDPLTWVKGTIDVAEDTTR